MSFRLMQSKYEILRAIRSSQENQMYKRRRRFAMGRRTGPSPYLWLNVSGDIALVQGNTAYEDLAVPADWSGTVTDQESSLVRVVIQFFTATTQQAGVDHAQVGALVIGNMSTNTTGSSVQDISNINEFPDFFAEFDDCLHMFRLEWASTGTPNAQMLPVQFSQLPDPIVNLRLRRKLEKDDTLRLCVGGAYAPDSSETYVVRYFARILVRIR